MRKVMKVIAAAILLAAIAAIGGNDARAAGGAAEKQIRKIDQQWVAAVAKKDPKAIAKFYAADGAILAPGAPIAQGRDAIEKAWAGFVGLKDF
jgi:ketosteroid isomerase-like protein